MSHPRDALYAWLGKNKKGTPNYEVQPSGKRGFRCTLRVPGYGYAAMGNSMNKKDAQTNAAVDFLNYLVRQGEMSQNQVPQINASTFEATSTPLQTDHPKFDAPAPGFYKNADMEQHFAGQPGRSHLTSHDLHVTQRAEEVAQSEAVDLRAEIHGGWTIDNSKQSLNEFLQKIKQPAAVYRTQRKENSQMSTDFCAQIACYIPHLGKDLKAEGNGSTKKMAEACCAMHMVRQLYHMKLLTAHQGKRRRVSKDNIPSVPVKLDDETVIRVRRYLAESVDISPANPNVDIAFPESPQNLLVDSKLAHFPDSEVSVPMNVSWSPPQQNWNPWRACNIDQEPLAFMTLPEISAKIAQKEAAKTASENIQQVRKELPVTRYRTEIINAVRKNRVTLIRGETGSGKSTQVAQFLLESYIEEGRGSEFNAFVSQPRRISAIALAERVAVERNEQLGESVGYGVRFDVVSPRPYGAIFFCTVGVLLRKMESGLRGVSHVIIDEIHERDIDTDFVLIVLRQMISEYPDLRIVLMSATINTELYSDYFGWDHGCPIISIEGRTHPVERMFLEDILPIINYMPPENFRTMDEEDDDTVDEKDRNLNILPSDAEVSPAIREAMSRISENDIPNEIIERILVDICEAGQEGAILIFLPGWQEISNLMQQLLGSFFGDESRFVVLPLHSQLTRQEQHRVFDRFPPNVRKIILSTNLAETSVTIEDVVYVIDSCKSRERLYSTTNNMVHYATVWASRSNMKQRCGRAGRVRPGFAFHLCSKTRFEVLDEHKTAEILRTPLTTVALTIKLLHLGSVGDFLGKAIEPPPLDMIVEAEAILQNMGALDRNLELTPLGRILAKLPIDPGMGKTIVLATALGNGSLMCELAAASSFSTPFVPRDRKMPRLSNRQRAFAGNRWSDHINAVAVNQKFCESFEIDGESAAYGFCQNNSLNMSMMKMTRGARDQLLEVLKMSGFPQWLLAPRYVNVHDEDEHLDLMTSLIVAAYYPNVGYYKGKRKLYTLEQASALVSKSSVITPFQGDVIVLPSPLIVFTEKVRTRTVQCKEITVVNALQLLLFGARKVECVGVHAVRLDDMILLEIDPTVAAAIVALRPCIESLLIRSCCNPESLETLNENDRELGQIIRTLSSPKYFSEGNIVKDSLLTDEAMQAVQPMSRPTAGGYRGRGGRGRGRGRRASEQNLWGFGPSAPSRGVFGEYERGVQTPGFGQSSLNNNLGGGYHGQGDGRPYGQGHYWQNFPSRQLVGSSPQADGGGKWPSSYARGGRGGGPYHISRASYRHGGGSQQWF